MTAVKICIQASFFFFFYITYVSIDRVSLIRPSWGELLFCLNVEREWGTPVPQPHLQAKLRQADRSQQENAGKAAVCKIKSKQNFQHV